MNPEKLKISSINFFTKSHSFLQNDLAEDPQQMPSVPISETIPPVPLETLPEQLPSEFLKIEIPDYMVSFSGTTQSYCVGMVDMIDSTKISSRLTGNQSSKYYAIFLNTMARILNRFGGMIIKNVGDSLMFYFPESSKGRRYGFMTCIEGGLALAEAHEFVCQVAKKEGLPPINYRISCDYGPVVIMKQNQSSQIDMIGTPMNISCKINHLTPKNGFVIGADLYQVTKKYPEYAFMSCGNYNSDLKSKYLVYLVSRN